MVILCITLCIKSFGNFMRFAMISNLKRLDFKVLEMKSIKLKLVILKAKQLGNLLFPLWKTALPAICKCVLHDSWCTFSFSNVVQADEILHWNGFELKAKQSISSTPHNAQSWKITQKVVWPKIQTSSRYLFFVAKRVKGGKVKAIAITGKERQ